MSDSLKALLHPFATGLLERPPGRAFFLRAETGLPDDCAASTWRTSD